MTRWSDFLRGTDGGLEVNRLVGAFGGFAHDIGGERLVNPCPCFTASDSTNRLAHNPINQREFALGQRRNSYFTHLRFGQLVTVAPCATDLRPVFQSIRRILTYGCPPKILGPVVKTIAVNVTGMVTGGWRRPKKCQRNHAMDVLADNLAIYGQAHGMICELGSASAWLQNSTDSGARKFTGAGLTSPYSAKRTRIIVGRTRNLLPNLNCGRIGGVSHVVSPHVRGQGRALLTQRFRPVFYGRFTLRSQGVSA